MTKVPKPAATPEKAITQPWPIFSVAHVAGQSVNSVMTPVAVKTRPISPGPHPRFASACNGTRVARVPALVMKIVAVTNAIARKGKLFTICATSPLGLVESVGDAVRVRVSGNRQIAYVAAKTASTPTR